MTQPDKRTVQLIVKVTADEKRAIVAGAARAKVNRSKWIRAVLLREAAPAPEPVEPSQ